MTSISKDELSRFVLNIIDENGIKIDNMTKNRLIGGTMTHIRKKNGSITHDELRDFVLSRFRPKREPVDFFLKEPYSESTLNESKKIPVVSYLRSSLSGFAEEYDPTLPLRPLIHMPDLIIDKYKILISSQFRNVKRDISPNRYTISFSGSTNTEGDINFSPGSIGIPTRIYERILNFELKKISIPDITSSSVSINDEQFLLLSIDEISRSNVFTPLKKVSNIFSTIFYDMDKNLESTYLNSEENTSVSWPITQLGRIPSITINLLDPRGNPFEFTQDRFTFYDITISSMSWTNSTTDLTKTIKTITFTTTDTVNIFSTGSKITFFEVSTTEGYEVSPGVYESSDPTLKNDINHNSFPINILTANTFSINIIESLHNTRISPTTSSSSTFYGINNISGGYFLVNSIQNTFLFEITALK